MTAVKEAYYADIVEAARKSPVIVAKCIPVEAVAAIEAWINALTTRHWRSGDESMYSWSEFHLAPEAVLPLVSDVPLLVALRDRASSTVSWVNRFEEGQWIAAHRDVGGDLQCIIPIVTPMASQGGQLWIGSLGHVVPAGPGDVLVFNAAKRSHGTSPVTASNAQRVTLNIRFWMRS